MFHNKGTTRRGLLSLLLISTWSKPALLCLVSTALALLFAMGCDSPVNTVLGIPTATPPLPTPYGTLGATEVITAGNAGRVALLHDLTGLPGGGRGVAFSPDGKLLAVAANEGLTRLWQATDGQLLNTLFMPVSDFGYMSSIAFSPDGKTLATAGRLKASQLWDMPNATAPHPLVGPDHVLYDVAYSPDGQTLATVGPVPTLRLHRAADGQKLRDLTVTVQARGTGGMLSVMWSVAYSPDSQIVAAGSLDGKVYLWRVADGVPIRTLTGHAGYVRDVAFSPDGQTLASSADDGTVRFWSLSDGRQTRSIVAADRDVFGIAFSPGGDVLATAAADVRLWRVSDGKLLATLPTNWIYSVAFSPDGRLLASTTGYGSVSIWGIR